jgi:DNA damage-binding protein 1
MLRLLQVPWLIRRHFWLRYLKFSPPSRETFIDDETQTEGSIYLFSLIIPSAQDLLMRLQTRMAQTILTLGGLDFNTYRSFKNSERETMEPFRFVDGELIERFLDVDEEVQKEICAGLGPSVEDVRNLVEELKRLH